ncbi:dUTP diphosphatase [Priestia flexa]|uniref:dUTP diphosphatase n=1 Tax=Priestia flexa TaxID=86664 RepID=UPI000C251023|nr:dUTP diphosphatase [Priestia flexa]MEC0666311.1 dUTP diphosphatase [Priestia flexa]
MNLKYLYEIQAGLMAHIEKNHPVQEGEDRNEKRLLAFIVELGECAQEHRGFKYWSKDQQPRTKAVRVPAMMEEDKEYYNPLLEEYVDGLHFVLELGLAYGIKQLTVNQTLQSENITKQFLEIIAAAMDYEVIPNQRRYACLLKSYLGLGEMLGFTQDEIEQAYLAKNEINHNRQLSNY